MAFDGMGAFGGAQTATDTSAAGARKAKARRPLGTAAGLTLALALSGCGFGSTVGSVVGGTVGGAVDLVVRAEGGPADLEDLR